MLTSAQVATVVAWGVVPTLEILGPVLKFTRIIRRDGHSALAHAGGACFTTLSGLTKGYLWHVAASVLP